MMSAVDMELYQAAQRATDSVLGAGTYVAQNGFDPSKGETPMGNYTPQNPFQLMSAADKVRTAAASAPTGDDVHALVEEALRTPAIVEGLQKLTGGHLVKSILQDSTVNAVAGELLEHPDPRGVIVAAILGGVDLGLRIRNLHHRAGS